jgi:DNA-binding LacI/PurR family transcriptional regulator
MDRYGRAVMPPRRAATIVDIARAADVSRTTASAALGGAGRISAATREHVRKVAEELGYVANATARHLQAGRKGAIGICVTDLHFSFGFYMDFVFGAAACCREDAFALTLISAGGGDGRPPIGHVDGVILVDPVAGDPVVHAILAAGIPVVSAERYLDSGPQPLVTIETEYAPAQRDLLDHLWDQGARAPALLTIPVEFSWKRLMEQVYRRWCKKHRVTPCVRVLEVSSDTEAVRRQARALLAEIDGVDAILAGADGTALGVLGAARDVGREVGVDLLVASNVDSIAMQLASPPVTAIETRPREIGADAARVLLAVLRGDEVPESVRRPQPTIAIRESTAALRPRTAAAE